MNTKDKGYLAFMRVYSGKITNKISLFNSS